MSFQAGPAQIRGGTGGEAFIAKYRVTAPCILVKSSDGVVTHAYENCLLEWLSPEQEKMFLEYGYVEVLEPEPVGKK